MPPTSNWVLQFSLWTQTNTNPACFCTQYCGYQRKIQR